MFLVREIVHCKPGKVRDMINRFKILASVMQRLGYKPYRILTDVSGERFWTVVLESNVEAISDFMEMEDRVMADEEAREAMAGYHELLESGRREFYKVEA